MTICRTSVVFWTYFTITYSLMATRCSPDWDCMALMHTVSHPSQLASWYQFELLGEQGHQSISSLPTFQFLWVGVSSSSSYWLNSRVDVLEPALSLNTGKTQFIWLGTKHSLAKRDTDRLHSLLPSLTELTSVRNLGFVIDQELIMKDHITKLCQSCYYQLCQIRTVRHSLTSSAIQTLVHAFICTRVDFANSLLYGTSAYLLDRLQSVLNSAARLILRIGKYDLISAAIRRDLHWLPIQFRIQYKLNSITSNCLAGRAPDYLIELCHFVNDIPARRNLRSSSQAQLLVSRYRKERSGRRGFSVSAPQLWNLLPSDIRLLHNEHQLFRKRLIICNSLFCATEDLCHQCELYYYYYYYLSRVKKSVVSGLEPRPSGSKANL